jgi:hypothetical protein
MVPKSWLIPTITISPVGTEEEQANENGIGGPPGAAIVYTAEMSIRPEIPKNSMRNHEAPEPL